MSGTLRPYELQPTTLILSLGFSSQKYWSGLPFLHLVDLPNPRIEPASPESPALAGGFFATSATWEAHSLLPHFLQLYQKVLSSISIFIIVKFNLFAFICLLPVEHKFLENRHFVFLMLIILPDSQRYSPNVLN